MGKGSARRPGKGYEDNWDRIFKKEPPPPPAPAPGGGPEKPQT